MPHVLNSNMFLKNGLKEETETGYHNEVCYYKNGVILRRWGHCSFLYIIPPILCAYLQSIAGDCFVSRPFYLLLSPSHAFSLSCSRQHSGDLRVKRSRKGGVRAVRGPGWCITSPGFTPGSLFVFLSPPQSIFPVFLFLFIFVMGSGRLPPLQSE